MSKDERAEIAVNEHYQVGEIVTSEGIRHLVTHVEFLSDDEAMEQDTDHDDTPFLGWNSTLMELDEEVMIVLSEQYKAGKVLFPAFDQVQFPDEEGTTDILKLAYSREIGLYNTERVKP